MHPKVLSEDAWSLIGRLVKSGLLDEWVLCGGTGMALQFGHRLSDYLDFFRLEPEGMELLPARLADHAPVEIVDRSEATLHVRAGAVRISFLGLEAPLLYPGIAYHGLKVGDTRDIASLKLVAIGGRGSRKDFIDLYFYLKQTPGLDEIFEHLERRNTRIDWNRFHLMKSLIYFEDAERDPMPRMLKDVDWEEVKEFFREITLSYL